MVFKSVDTGAIDARSPSAACGQGSNSLSPGRMKGSLTHSKLKGIIPSLQCSTSWETLLGYVHSGTCIDNVASNQGRPVVEILTCPRSDQSAFVFCWVFVCVQVAGGPGS